MVINILTKLKKTMDEHIENFNKETEIIGKYQAEVTKPKNTIT